MTRMRFHQNAGLTLVEVIVAMAVLSLAFVAAGALAAASTRSNTEAGRRSQATDLATYELEALRSLRNGLAERSDPDEPSNVPEYLEEERGMNLDDGCYALVMRPDNGNELGWRADSAPNPVAYGSSDFSGFIAVGSGDDSDQFPNVDNFSRRVRLCPLPDTVEGASVATTNHLYDVVVTVQWREGVSQERELTYRVVMATPEAGLYE